MTAALTVGSGVMASSASAYEGGQALKCTVFSSTANWDGQHTMTMSPASPEAGETVTITETYSQGPDNGPVALQPGVVSPTATVKLSGGTTGTVTLTGAANAAQVPPNSPMPGGELTGTFTAGEGTTTATVEGFVFNAPSFGLVIPCNAGSDPANDPKPTTIIESVTAAAATQQQVAIDSVDGQAAGVTAFARATNTIHMSLTGFTPGATATATMCDVAGDNCDDATATGTLDGSGAASMALELGSYQATTKGSRTVHVTDGTLTKMVPITIMNSGKVAITPASGGVGTVVTLTGTNFDPGSEVYYGTLVPDTSGAFPPVKASADAPKTATADDAGNVGPVTFTVGDPGTTYLAMLQGVWDPQAKYVAGSYMKFGISADTCDATATPCSLEYNLKQMVKGGSLSMERTPGSSTITFSDVSTSDEVQSSSADLDTVTVKDVRGGTLGWSLVGTATDLTTAGGASIPASALAWTPTCGDHAGAANVSTATAGSAGSFGGDALTLCNGDQNATAGASTGGLFDAAASLELSVPEFQQAGDYAGTLTLTLS